MKFWQWFFFIQLIFTSCTFFTPGKIEKDEKIIGKAIEEIIEIGIDDEKDVK